VAIRAITFDYWNTIMYAVDPQGAWRRQAWLELLADGGHEADDDTVRTAFQAAWALHHQAWIDNVQFSGRTFADAAVAALALDLAPDLRDGLVDAFMHEGDHDEYEPCPGVEDAIRTAAGSGVRLGIICDVGITPSTGLRRLLERRDLLRHFTGWSFSDEVGRFKPAPEIFRHALGVLGTTPDETAHVGDLRRTDVAGALGMGMTSVRYRGIFDDPADGDEGDHVIDHHDELLVALGLG
jgi:putative hydrolase of the HAD superfamily